LIYRNNHIAPVADKTLRFIDKGATPARPEFLEA
jgi:hypothetical protein